MRDSEGLNIENLEYYACAGERGRMLSRDKPRFQFVKRVGILSSIEGCRKEELEKTQQRGEDRFARLLPCMSFTRSNTRKQYRGPLTACSQLRAYHLRPRSNATCAVSPHASQSPHEFRKVWWNTKFREEGWHTELCRQNDTVIRD